MPYFTPIGAKVLLQTRKSPGEINGIVVPENQRKEHHIAKVLAVGPAVTEGLHPGNDVMYYPGNGYEVAEDRRIINSADIIGIVYD